MPFDLRLLRYAVALADHENFSVAARVLGISQPALSRAIQRLEGSVGARLFDRTSAGVFPTDAGELMLARAEDLLAGAESLERELSRVRAAEHPSVAMGAGPFTAQLMAGDAIARLLRAVPGTFVQLRIEQFPELARMVRAREIDLAVAEASTVAARPDLEVIPLEPVQGWFAARAGHPLAGRGGLSLKQILAYPLVFSGRIPPRILEPLLAAAPRSADSDDGAQPAAVPAIDAPSLSVIVDVVAGSDAVGPVTPTMARPGVEAGRLVLLDAELPWLRTDFAILLPKDRRPSEVLDRAVTAVREAGEAWAEQERAAERELLGQ